MAKRTRIRRKPLRPLAERFWEKVQKKPGRDACWLFTGSHNSDGYGSLRIGTKTIGAHIIAYELQRGRVPRGKQVHHTCDVRDCVRGKHLWTGTQRQNIADRVAKGRNGAARGQKNGRYTHPESVPRGEDHARAKLTTADIRKIRKLLDLHAASMQELGRTFGVTKWNIASIKSRRTWKHIH